MPWQSHNPPFCSLQDFSDIYYSIFEKERLKEMLKLCVLIDLFHEARMQKLNLILVLSIVNYSKCCIVPCKLSQYCTIWGYWYWYQEFLTAAKWESLAKTFKSLKKTFLCILQWKRLSSKLLERFIWVIYFSFKFFVN